MLFTLMQQEITSHILELWGGNKLLINNTHIDHKENALRNLCKINLVLCRQIYGVWRHCYCNRLQTLIPPSGSNTIPQIGQIHDWRYVWSMEMSQRGTLMGHDNITLAALHIYHLLHIAFCFLVFNIKKLFHFPSQLFLCYTMSREHVHCTSFSTDLNLKLQLLK